jgi:hypothetical protein
VLPALNTHEFSKAFQQPAAYRPGRLRGYIPQANPGAPGGDHQTSHCTLFAERILDHQLLIRHENVSDDGKPVRFKQLHHSRTGKVCPASFERGVAYRDYRSAKHIAIVRVVPHLAPYSNSINSL